ncbi:MAG: hypothetical protein JWM99_4379 [Verrucomicrobiales bacterium]|nr:hypothetical protein [Verrucomicrobiales bacterium]
MQKIRLLALTIAALVLPFHPVIGVAQIVAISENFDLDPLHSQWTVFGDADLFRWNSIEKNLEVIWDSARPNSYLRFPLNTIVTRHDDFSVSLDLLLNDIAAGANPDKPGTLQLAFGFQNSADAAKTNYYRGTGSDSPNLVEFSFYPDAGYGPTVWPGIMATNSAMNYNGPQDFGIFDLPLDVVMHIGLTYMASNETASISITTNGVLVGPITSARLATNSVGFGTAFTQFKLDTFAISSYSDAGQNPAYAGSLLAHGIVDNVRLEFPASPVQELKGDRNNGTWNAWFLTRTNWNYQLEATEDFEMWTPIGKSISGNGGPLQLQETNSPAFGARFYRINAQRAD